jgi:SpoVK/Ycf46/Vps4 family AAA+-type ATPase
MCPQVFIDTSGPEFIGWDDINGIDEVKQEIEEIIDYLKNPGEGKTRVLRVTEQLHFQQIRTAARS